MCRLLCTSPSEPTNLEAPRERTSGTTVLSEILSPMQIDTGDTAFVLVSCALVQLMTPGLGFFYGGMVRSRNVLNTLMLSFATMAVIGVTWVLWGYSLAFAPGKGALAGWIGT